MSLLYRLTRSAVAGGWAAATCRLAAVNCLAALLGLTLVGSPVFGQGTPRVVVLMDGTQYEGYAGSTEAITLGAEAPQPFESRPIASIDDGMRRIYVNRARMVANVQDSQLFASEKKIDLPNQRANDSSSPGFGAWLGYGPFNEFGHRTLSVLDSNGRVSNVVQGITQLTPRYATLKTLLGGEGVDKNWEMQIPTGSIPPAVLRRLLRNRMIDRSNPDEFLNNIEFYQQARRYEEAIEEAEYVLTLFPDQADRLNEVIVRLRQSQGRQILDEVRLRLASNQTELALTWAQLVDRGELARRIGADFDRELTQQMEQVEALAALKVAVLADLEKQLGAAATPEEGAALQAFSSELEAGLDVRSALRLDAWKLRSVDPQFNLQQRVALAISGWILGSNDATDNYAVSRSLIDVRRLVREYLGGADAIRRAAILEELAAMEGSEPELLSRVIRQLGPVQPVDLSAYSGAEPIRFTVQIPGNALQKFQPQEVECLAHLPPGYSPSSEYPLLVTLGYENSAQRMLDFWCGDFNPKLRIRQGQALRFGFVVVSVNWMLPGQNACGYSAREHAAVLAAVRGSLRRFAVDPDRVILHGMATGATLAYDVALSHPDVFAGVAGFSGQMDRYPEFYCTNEHPPLAVYSVVGQKDTGSIGRCMAVWNEWLTSNTRFNLLTLVIYKGRLNEPFPEEQEPMLNWALRRLRYWPGRGDDLTVDCRILRPWDSFYWLLELGGLPDDRLMPPEEWRDKDRPKAVSLSINRKAGNPNLFRLGPSQNVGSGATLWLSNEYCDLSQRIEIDGRGSFKDFVIPSRRTMLEDVRQRGDRKHPFWAKLVERNKKWVVEE